MDQLMYTTEYSGICPKNGEKEVVDPTLKDDMLLLGLYIFWNPAILDWRTWRKFGEHGEHGKHQPDKVKHSMIKNTLFMAQNTILQCLSQQLKNHNIQLGEQDPGSAQDWIYQAK